MHHNYRDYYWKMGKPYGREIAEPTSKVTYKIMTDPYGKRYSIEKYRQGAFEKVVYDSLLLDFRQLTLVNQTAWQRERLKEEGDKVFCLLRNQEDRAILLETHFFADRFCYACEIFSIHGLPLATQKQYYQTRHDPFNGVALFDLEQHPVMLKTYQIDPTTGEFTVLLEENWNMQTVPSLLQDSAKIS